MVRCTNPMTPVWPYLAHGYVFLRTENKMTDLFSVLPKGTEAVEELIWDLRGTYTILIVTHNMAQARRASEECISC